jgi:DeoR family lactose phosphotransferase system repressor
VLRRERLVKVENIVNQEGIVMVANLVNKLQVSDMTIRRDLAELEGMSRVIRIHGGAQSLDYNNQKEVPHREKKAIHHEEKRAVAKAAVSSIREGDTIFLGTGTTVELMSEFLKLSFIRVVTNSLPVFDAFRKQHPQYENILIGGNYRERTGAFVGSIANLALEKMRFSRSFVGVNGINKENIFTSNMDEGTTQRLAMNNASKRYILADYHKLNKESFYEFYKIKDIDVLVTNSEINVETTNYYEKYINLLLAEPVQEAAVESGEEKWSINEHGE